MATPESSTPLSVAAVQELPTTDETLTPAQITRDERVQRSLSSWFVEKIAGNLNLNALGAIVVSLRANGDYVVLDGGHRIEALLKKGLGDLPLKAIVHRDLTRSDEAKLFLFYNNRRSVPLFERFRIAVEAEDPESVALSKLIAKAGLHLSANSSKGGVSCIGTIIDIYRGSKNSTKGHPAELEKTLATLVDAWGAEGSVLRETIYGIGDLYLTFGDKIDQGHLVLQLQKLRGGPNAIKTKAGQLHELRVGKTLRESCLRAVIDTYNGGMRSGKLSL